MQLSHLLTVSLTHHEISKKNTIDLYEIWYVASVWVLHNNLFYKVLILRSRNPLKTPSIRCL